MTDPRDSAQSFDFDATGSGFIDFSLTDGDTPNDQEVVPGAYSISEGAVEGWSSDGGTCDLDETPASLDVGAGETVTCTFTNTRDTGTLQVLKNVDLNGDGDYEDEDETGSTAWEWQYDGGSDQNTGDDPITLNTGDYDLTETVKDGFTQLDLTCEGGDLEGNTVTITKDADVVCTFVNTPNGRIHGQKWNDLDGDGLKNGEEGYLSGWKIFIDENDNQTWDDGEKFMLTDDGQEFGWYWFDHLIPGTYNICEVPQNGWLQTYPNPTCHAIDVNVEGETNTCTVSRDLNSNDGGGYKCDFGNQLVLSSISLAKTNDHTGGASAGDTVTYTLTLTNGQVLLSNVIVTDILPSGFTYIAGTTTGASEPTVSGNTLKWTIDTIAAGAITTIAYQAKIDSGQQGGTYYNMATCKGLSRQEQLVMCNVVNSEVPIGQNFSYNTTISGSVLGVSTVLGAATGSETYWLIMALLMIMGGFYINRKGFTK